MKNNMVEWESNKNEKLYKGCAETEIKELIYTGELSGTLYDFNDNFNKFYSLKKETENFQYIISINTSGLRFYAYKKRNLLTGYFKARDKIKLENIDDIFVVDGDGNFNSIAAADIKRMFEKNRLKYISENERYRFQKWIGNSYVKDKTGDPMVCYHGTVAERDFLRFRHFNIKSNSKDLNSYIGPHFSNSPHSAAFVYSADDLGRIIPVYLKIENPITFYGKESEKRMNTEIIKNSNSADYLHNMLNEQLKVLQRHDPSINYKKEINDLVEEYVSFKYSHKFFDGYYSYHLFEISKIPILSIINEFEQISRKYINLAAAQAKRHFVKSGYDGIIYENLGEGGIAYIPFSEKQIWWCFKRKNRLK